MMLHHLEMLEGATPPAQFDLARHPEADTDGDGAVSDAEWTAFATQSNIEPGAWRVLCSSAAWRAAPVVETGRSASKQRRLSGTASTSTPSGRSSASQSRRKPMRSGLCSMTCEATMKS